MIDYVMDYLASQGIYALTQSEQEMLTGGINKYLFENGIENDDTGEYYKKYVVDHLKTIAVPDLKQYFINYPLISHIKQIVIEFQNDGELPKERKQELYELMEKLHRCGLEEKYVPIIEVKQILGRLS